MKKEDKLTVLEGLYKSETLTTTELVDLLGVSVSTVRRWMIDLENEDLITRIHGGIRLKKDVSKYLFSEKELVNAKAKNAIANYVAHNFVNNNDVIYLDSGTTAKQFAIALSKRFLNNNLHKLTVITNSLANMEILNSYCEVVLLGGIYREELKDFAGYPTERFLECFNYQKAFLGADGFDIDSGFSGNDHLTVAINELVIARSIFKYVLLDSSKFNNRAYLSYAGFSQIDAMITDKKLNTDIQQELNNRHIKFYTVEF